MHADCIKIVNTLKIVITIFRFIGTKRQADWIRIVNTLKIAITIGLRVKYLSYIIRKHIIIICYYIIIYIS